MPFGVWMNGKGNAMILRCQVVDDVWWLALQLEEVVKGKLKIIPIGETNELIDTPTVVSFQGVDQRYSPPYFQILPCPQCGVSEDNNHDPLKHMDPNLGHVCGQGNCPDWCKS
jgi:hypothetical protein